MYDASMIRLAHGGGGRLGRRLIRDEIRSRFQAEALKTLPDAATLRADGVELVFSTDGYVVTPWRFPGGNIGHLAVHGTVNDIAAGGGRPRWLSMGLIVEEGFALADLREILDAARDAARACNVEIVTGDTKVVGKGQCDGVFVTTAGIGTRIPAFRLGPDRIRPGDRVLASGTLGDHGMAVMAARLPRPPAAGPTSDTASIAPLVETAAAFGDAVRFFRDPTRGGPAAVLHEIMEDAPVGFELEETALPFAPAARALADLLGIDLLHAPCEGRLIAVCSPEAADPLLAQWRARPEGREAVAIGRVTEDAGRLVLNTVAGGRRLVDSPEGELLPRIC